VFIAAVFTAAKAFGIQLEKRLREGIKKRI